MKLENETRQISIQQSQYAWLSIDPLCASTLAGASVRANRHPPPFWRERTRKIDTNESAYNLQSVLFYVIDITSDDSFNLILFSLCCRFSRLLPAGSTLFQFAI